MDELMPRVGPPNSEGYCRECGQPLGISGQCYNCAVTDLDFEEIRREVHKIYYCAICGQHKVHYRIGGYRCRVPGHTEMENNQVMEDIRRRAKQQAREQGDV